MKVLILLNLAAIMYQVNCKPFYMNTPGSDILRFLAHPSTARKNIEPIFSKIGDFKDNLNMDIPALFPFWRFILSSESESDETTEEKYDDQTIIQNVTDRIYRKDLYENIPDGNDDEEMPQDSSPKVKEENKNSCFEQLNSNNDSKEASKFDSSEDKSESKESDE